MEDSEEEAAAHFEVVLLEEMYQGGQSRSTNNKRSEK